MVVLAVDVVDDFVVDAGEEDLVVVGVVDGDVDGDDEDDEDDEMLPPLFFGPASTFIDTT